MTIKWSNLAWNDLIIERSDRKLGSASDWFKICFIQSEALPRSLVRNFYAGFSDVILQVNRWWRLEMLAVFSGCTEVWLWLEVTHTNIRLI